jgi:sarcosine oxidase, subunit gamma
MTSKAGASMLEPNHETALAQLGDVQGTYVSIREITSRGMIDLRGAATDRKFLAAAKDVLGVALPREPRSAASFGDVKILWLSPDQWLVLCARDKAAEITRDLGAALANTHALAVDVSDMRCIIRLEGEAVREVMMKSGSVDFLADDVQPGYVRRMRFAEIAALFNVVENNVIDVFVFRSQAQYAVDFLRKAARNGSAIGLFSNKGLA